MEKEKGLGDFSPKPLICGAPGAIRTPDPLVRSRPFALKLSFQKQSDKDINPYYSMSPLDHEIPHGY